MWMNLVLLFQPVNKLKMRYHKKPSFSLMSKNQMRRTYLVTYRQADKSKMDRTGWKRGYILEYFRR